MLHNWKVNIVAQNIESGIEKDFNFSLKDSSEILSLLSEMNNTADLDKEYEFLYASIFNDVQDPQDYEEDSFDDIDEFKQIIILNSENNV